MASSNFGKDKPKIKNQSETSESMFLSRKMLNKISKTSRGSQFAHTTNQSFMGAFVKPLPYKLDSNFEPVWFKVQFNWKLNSENVPTIIKYPKE